MEASLMEMKKDEKQSACTVKPNFRGFSCCGNESNDAEDNLSFVGETVEERGLQHHSTVSERGDEQKESSFSAIEEMSFLRQTLVDTAIGLRLFDSHCHLQLPACYEEVNALLQRAVDEGVIGLSICGTCPGMYSRSLLLIQFSVFTVVNLMTHFVTGEDWRRVERLCNERSSNRCLIVPHFGLHPWFISQHLSTLTEHSYATSNDVQYWEPELVRLLLAYPSAGVGECGLDKGIKREVSTSQQVDILRRHIVIAAQYHRILTLHCVRMYGTLLDTLTDYLQPNTTSDPILLRPRAILLHSCNYLPAEMVSSFLSTLGDTEVYFSISAPPKTPSSKFVELLRSIPLDRLLIETDSPDQLSYLFRGDSSNSTRSINEPALIKYSCAQLARCLDLSPRELAEITTSNALRLFCTN